MKQFLVVCILFLSFSMTAQSLMFSFKGTVENSDLGKGETGVSVSIVQNGSTITNSTTASNGKYTLKGNVNYAQPFQVVFSKGGMVSKKVSFNFVGLNEEDVPAGAEYSPVTDLSMKLFAERANADFSFLNSESVAVFNWNATKAAAELDKIGSEKTKAKIDKLLLESEQKKVADEAKYQAAVTAADAFYAQKKYEEALAKYEEANGIKPKETHPIQRITELDALIAANKKANLESQLADTEYQNLITAANTLRDQKKYDLAIAKYKEALAKRDEQMPKDQIATLEKIVADQKKEQENEEKYQETIKLADMLFNQKTYGKAKEKYTLATQLKSSEQHPKTRLIEIEKKLAEQNVANEKKVKYEEALAAADALFGEQKIEEAKAKYTEALGYEPASTSAEDGVQKCATILLEKAKEKEKAEKIAKLLTEGGVLISGNKLPEAKAKYVEVLSMDNTNAEAIAKTAEIDLKLKDAAALAEKEAQFTKLVFEGDLAVKGLKYADAKTKYETALALKTDVPTQAKLDGVNVKLSELATAAEKKQKFDQAMLDADALFKESKWEEAKAKYNEAIGFDGAALLPKDKVKQCDAKLIALSKDKEKTEKINALLIEGNQLFTAEKWEDSKVKYTEVIGLDPTNTEAKKQLTEIAKKQQELAVQIANTEKFNKLVAEGDGFGKALKYQEAIVKYEAAIEIKADAGIQAKIDESKTKLKELAEKESIEEQFQRIKSEGMKLAAEQKNQAAKDKLIEAQKIKDDAAVTAKIKELDEKLKAEAEAELAEKEYQALLADAQSKEAAKDIDGAIAKYTEALAKRPTDAFPKRKMEELKVLKMNSSNQKEIDAKYEEYIKKGDELVAQEKFLDAIKEYNLANNQKPEAPEAVLKAKEAERLEKIKHDEGEQAYLKILTIAQTKIDEKDYTKARELAERALNGRPTDPRPKELLLKIADLELAEKNYSAKMKEAETFASAKEYQKALVAFEQAKVIKPTEEVPQKRIDEIKTLIDNILDQQAKEKLYVDHMAKGAVNQSAKSYEQALSHYQNALAVKPGDKAASDKINELQQLLDDIANKTKSELEKKNKFEAFITAGDNAFSSGNYQDAISSYKSALQIENTNQYLQKQIEEAETRILTNEKNAAEMDYQQIIASANDFFSIASYDKAKEKYTEALAKRPSDEFPKTRLAEIDAILNPTIVKSSTLEPLGDPYDNSIMDGYAALVKADIERKNLQSNEVLTQVEDVVVTQDKLMTGKVSDQQETTNEIYLLRNTIAIQDEEGDIGRQATVDVLRADERTRVNETIEADGYEKAENLRSKETIHEALVSTENEKNTRDGVHLENTDKISSITFSQAEMNSRQALSDAVLNVTADQTLENVKSSMAENENGRNEERKKVEEQVKVLKVTEAEKSDELISSKTDQVRSTKKEIEDVKITASDLENDGSLQTESNDNQLKIIQVEVNNGVQNLENKQTESSYELNRGVEVINLTIEENKVERDMNRIETDATLREENKTIEEKQFEDYSNETVKYLKNKNEINNAVESTVEIDEVAEFKHASKVEEVKKIDKNLAIVNVESDLTDEQTRQKAKSTIVVANTAAELNSTNSTQKQEENAYKFSDMDKAKESDLVGKEMKDTEKHYAAQKQLNSVDNSKPEKVIVANTLGQEYPEGVSQESFTQADENGLMTAIITRRIVVINGQGNVYVRTQTLNTITYTKNGEASTEYVWQKETQSSKLERHF